MAELTGDDLILCQITSQAKTDKYSISLESSDFAVGSLNQSSRIRPNRLFTADSSIISYMAGRISKAKLDEAIEKLIEILQRT